MEYAAFTVLTVVILALLATATEILDSRTGRLGVSAVVIAAVSAHAYAVARAANSWWLAVILALAAGALAASASATVIHRIPSDMFLLVTLAAQLLLISIIRNTPALGGMIGIGVPISPFGSAGLSAIAILACAASIVMTQRIFDSHSVIAAAYVAIADDEIGARSSGLPVGRLRRKATLYHGFLASVAGILAALQYRYVAAEIFDFRLTLTVLTAMYVGGPGQPPYRQVYGAAVVVAVEEGIAWLLSGSAMTGPFQRVVVNALLIAILAAHVLRSRRKV